MTTTYNFSEKSKQVLHIASQLAKENMHDGYGAAHLLKALMHKQMQLLKFLESKGIDVYYVEEWAEIRIEQYPRSSRLSTDPEGDGDTEILFKEADHLQTKLNYHAIEPECLFIAIATPGVAFTYEQLKTFPVSSAQVLQWYETAGGQSSQSPPAKPMVPLPRRSKHPLKQLINSVQINCSKRGMAGCRKLLAVIRN